jgi:uncharacterized protein
MVSDETWRAPWGRAPNVENLEKETPMAEHPNAALVRRGFVAFNSADIATLTEIIAPDAVQHMPGNNRFSGDHKGLENILGMYGTLAEQTGGTFSATVEAIFANDHGAVAIYRTTATRGSRTLDQRDALVFEIMDGRAVDITEMPLDGEVNDEFWE